MSPSTAVPRGAVVAAATATPDGADAGWPWWARPQLRQAVRLADRIERRGQRIAVAPELYRLWFNPVAIGPAHPLPSARPLVGTYRASHAGSAIRLQRDGVATVDRHDVIGRDGWWRTWGDSWHRGGGRTPTVRLVLSPRPDLIDRFVAVVTAALIAESTPWLLACPTDARRLRRTGAAVLQVDDPAALPTSLRAELRPLLLPAAPPLCLPWQPGVALADNPDNGMSFGEHRCHLIALALRNRPRQAPLRAIAEVFSAHGIDPRRPHETRSR